MNSLQSTVAKNIKAIAKQENSLTDTKKLTCCFSVDRATCASSILSLYKGNELVLSETLAVSNVCLHAPRPPLELVSRSISVPWEVDDSPLSWMLSLWWLTLGCCVLWGWAHPFWLLWVKPAFVATLLNGQRWHVYFLHLCPVSQIPSSEGAARKSWGGRGTALDGSYLGLPLSGSRTDRGGSVECTHSFSTGPFSAPSSSDQNCETHVRHTNHNSEGGRSDLRFSNRDPLPVMPWGCMAPLNPCALISATEWKWWHVWC